MVQLVHVTGVRYVATGEWDVKKIMGNSVDLDSNTVYKLGQFNCLAFLQQ